MLHSYETQITQARLLLRKKEVSPNLIRSLVRDKEAMEAVPLDRLRDAVVEMDKKNLERVAKYKDQFAQLATAAKTVISMVVDSGVVESATPGAGRDALEDSIRASDGRKYYVFRFVTKAGLLREHTGYIEFGTGGQGLLIPTWANIDGNTMSLLETGAFEELRPWIVQFEDKEFRVVHR